MIRGKKFTKREFTNLQQRDKIKNRFANQNNITLIRVPYFVDNIKEFIVQSSSILKEILG